MFDRFPWLAQVHDFANYRYQAEIRDQEGARWLALTNGHSVAFQRLEIIEEVPPAAGFLPTTEAIASALARYLEKAQAAAGWRKASRATLLGAFSAAGSIRWRLDEDGDPGQYYQTGNAILLGVPISIQTMLYTLLLLEGSPMLELSAISTGYKPPPKVTDHPDAPDLLVLKAAPDQLAVIMRAGAAGAAWKDLDREVWHWLEAKAPGP